MYNCAGYALSAPMQETNMCVEENNLHNTKAIHMQ